MNESAQGCSAVHTVYIYIFCAEKCDFYLCYYVYLTIKLIIQKISHCFALYNIVEIQDVWMIEWLNGNSGLKKFITHIKTLLLISANFYNALSHSNLITKRHLPPMCEDSS